MATSKAQAASVAVDNVITIVPLEHSRDTKGTHVYVGDADGVITNIYIKKGSLGDTPPEKIQIVVHAV